jgi:zinc transport system substrate-binding protein
MRFNLPETIAFAVELHPDGCLYLRGRLSGCMKWTANCFNVSRVVLIAAVFVVWNSIAWAEEKLPVFVSILPQKFFVQQIGGELVDVSVLVEPGASPATYEPKPKQMAALSRIKIYFAIGVPFEKVWLGKIVSANPNMLVVRTDSGIEKIPMTAHQHPTEKIHPHDLKENGPRQGPQHDDADNTARQRMLDPHIWLSPPLVKIQARYIFEALQSVDPSHGVRYRTNYQKFLRDLDEIDAELKDIFAGKKGLEFFVLHPSWGYFAHAYGLKQVSIEIEGKDPKPAQLIEIIQHAKDKDIKVLFVQPQFSTKSAEIIAKAIGAQIVFANPLAADWADNLRRQAREFKAALK